MHLGVHYGLRALWWGHDLLWDPVHWVTWKFKWWSWRDLYNWEKWTCGINLCFFLLLEFHRPWLGFNHIMPEPRAGFPPRVADEKRRNEWTKRVSSADKIGISAGLICRGKHGGPRLGGSTLKCEVCYGDVLQKARWPWANPRLWLTMGGVLKTAWVFLRVYVVILTKKGQTPIPMPKINQVYLYKLGEDFHPSYSLFN